MSQYVSPYSLSLLGVPHGEKKDYRYYLQQKEFVKDITESNVEVQYAISHSARELLGTVEQLKSRGFKIAESINAGLSDLGQMSTEGFESVAYELENVSQGIAELTAKCDWGFAELIAGIGHVNDSLQDLISVSKTPAQTWAYNQFEIARDALRRELYPEALESLDRAIHGFGSNTGYKLDYRFHYTKGVLHLGDFRNADPKVVNPAQAEEALATAGRYAKRDFPQEAVAALVAASWAAYVQGKLQEAEGHVADALSIIPDSGAALYQIAKVWACQGRVGDAFDYLGRAIAKDVDYSVKAAADPDFLKYHSSLTALLERFRSSARDSYESRRRDAESVLDEFVSWEVQNLNAKEVNIGKTLYIEAKQNAATETFFGFLDALPVLDQVIKISEEGISKAKQELAVEFSMAFEHLKKFGLIKTKNRNYQPMVAEAEEVVNAVSALKDQLRTRDDYLRARKQIEKALEVCRVAKDRVKEAFRRARRRNIGTRWIVALIVGGGCAFACGWSFARGIGFDRGDALGTGLTLASVVTLVYGVFLTDEERIRTGHPKDFS